MMNQYNGQWPPPCTHTPLALAKEKAASLRRSLESVDAWRRELAQLERMIAAADEPTK